MKQKNFQRVEIFMGRLFISVIVCIITFTIIEVISRKFISPRPTIERRFPVQYTRHPRPYSMFAGKPNAHKLNNMGYKGDVPQMPKPPGEFRIFFLGGSTVYAGNPPISDLVQELFQQDEISNVHIYNFGVVSSVSGMELARIVFEISDLAPDLIVMYNGGNDFLNPWSWDPRPGYPLNFIVYENNPLLDKDLKSYPTFALLLYGSNIMRYLLRDYFVKKFIPLEQTRTESHYKSSEWREKIAAIYVNNIVKAAKVSKAFGAEFVTFFQPLVYFKETLSAEERLLGIYEQGIYANQIREIILTKISRIEDDNILKFVDLSNIYKGNTSQIFKDAIHTRQEAKSVVAHAVYKRLVGIYRENSAD
jgi:hypothetical protein